MLIQPHSNYIPLIIPENAFIKKNNEQQQYMDLTRNTETYYKNTTFCSGFKFIPSEQPGKGALIIPLLHTSRDVLIHT